MQYILLLIVLIASTGSSLAKKQYSIKVNESAPFLFSAASVLAAMLCFFAAAGFRLEFRFDVFLHSVGFAAAYSAACAGAFFAIKWGPLSISTLITNYSLMIPVVYGIVILQEQPTVLGITGIILLAVSLFLISDKSAKGAFSVKWLISIIIGFIGNGMCSTLQKHQQVTFDGAYKSEFMIMALMLSFVFFMIIAVIRKEKFGKNVLSVLPYGAMTGVADGIVNYLVMVLTALIPNAILFPTISAGGVVLGFITATALYKEKLTKMQLAGYFIGVLSVVALNM